MKLNFRVLYQALSFLLVTFLLPSITYVHAYTLSAEAQAAYDTAAIYGDGFGAMVGVYDGNTDLTSLTTILQGEGVIGGGTTLQQLAKSDEANPNFTIDTLYFKDNDPSEPIIGTWDFDPVAGAVDFLVVKAATQFAVYAYDSAIAGGWSTLDIIKTFGNLNQPFAMSHITAVSAVPLPAAAPLFLSAFVVFGLIAARRKKIRS